MGERRIDDLEHLSEGEPEGGGAAPPASAVPPPRPPEALVDINYPEPTLLSHILKDVAKWSGQCFVMEPAANQKLQIFAAQKMPRGKAYDLFLASLSVVGLRAVQRGDVVKIVPAGLPAFA